MLLHTDTGLNFADAEAFGHTSNGEFDPAFRDWLVEFVDERYRSRKNETVLRHRRPQHGTQSSSARGDVEVEDQPFLCRPRQTGHLGRYRTPW